MSGFLILWFWLIIKILIMKTNKGASRRYLLQATTKIDMYFVSSLHYKIRIIFK